MIVERIKTKLDMEGDHAVFVRVAPPVGMVFSHSGRFWRVTNVRESVGGFVVYFVNWRPPRNIRPERLIAVLLERAPRRNHAVLQG